MRSDAIANGAAEEAIAALGEQTGKGADARMAAAAADVLVRLATFPPSLMRHSLDISMLRKTVQELLIRLGVCDVLADAGAPSNEDKAPDCFLDVMHAVFADNRKALVNKLSKQADMFRLIVDGLETNDKAKHLLTVLNYEQKLPMAIVNLYKYWRFSIPPLQEYWRSTALDILPSKVTPDMRKQWKEQRKMQVKGTYMEAAMAEAGGGEEAHAPSEPRKIRVLSKRKPAALDAPKEKKKKKKGTRKAKLTKEQKRKLADREKAKAEALASKDRFNAKEIEIPAALRSAAHQERVEAAAAAVEEAKGAE